MPRTIFRDNAVTAMCLRLRESVCLETTQWVTWPKWHCREKGGVLGNSYPVSCIASVHYPGSDRGYAALSPGPLPAADPSNMLWGCIKIQGNDQKPSRGNVDFHGSRRVIPKTMVYGIEKSRAKKKRGLMRYF